MCTYSAIADYGRTRIPMEQWTPPVWNEYKEILEKLKDLDKKLDQSDCEDPNKLKWMDDVERRLKRLEDAAI